MFGVYNVEVTMKLPYYTLQFVVLFALKKYSIDTDLHVYIIPVDINDGTNPSDKEILKLCKLFYM